MSKASVYFQVQNLNHERDVRKIKQELDTLRGVISVSADMQAGSVAVDYDTTGVEQSRIENKIQQLGYPIMSNINENHKM